MSGIGPFEFMKTVLRNYTAFDEAPEVFEKGYYRNMGYLDDKQC